MRLEVLEIEHLHWSESANREDRAKFDAFRNYESPLRRSINDKFDFDHRDRFERNSKGSSIFTVDVRGTFVYVSILYHRRSFAMLINACLCRKKQRKRGPYDRQRIIRKLNFNGIEWNSIKRTTRCISRKVIPSNNSDFTGTLVGLRNNVFRSGISNTVADFKRNAD